MAQLVFFGLIGMAATILSAGLNSRDTVDDLYTKLRPLGTVSWNG